MIFSYFLLLFSFLIFINANDQYHIGIINHDTQWNIHCLKNQTRLINPPLNDQPSISYQCPYPSLSINIIPIEIDFTFICRLESRLIWIIIDLYQYKYSLINSIDIEKANISLKLNQQIQIKDSKNEITNYNNRSIIINAFYIPFESIEYLLNKYVEISIEINQCKFILYENSTWNDIIYKNCHLYDSNTLFIQSAQCDFFPKSISESPFEELDDDNITDLPDYNVVLSIDSHQPTTIQTTTRYHDYHLLFDAHYQKILTTLTIISRASNLITFIFIFTIIILILLIILFIYILCYHYYARSIRKSSLLI